MRRIFIACLLACAANAARADVVLITLRWSEVAAIETDRPLAVLKPCLSTLAAQ